MGEFTEEELANEEWRDIVGWEGLYQVSNLGRVRSLTMLMHTRGEGVWYKNGKILKPYVNRLGYWRYCLSHRGCSKKESAHRLVAEAFIPNPNGYPIINHKDENPSNNRISNLEWCTHKYNNGYGTKPERCSKALRNYPDWSYPVLQYDMQYNFIQEYPSIKEVERVTGIDRCNVMRCCEGKQLSTHDYIFKYKERN